MKYSVVKCVNSNFAIVSEHSDIQSARVKFHDVCKTHWNAQDVETAMIAIFDENLDSVCKEYIYHESVVEAESEGE